MHRLLAASIIAAALTGGVAVAAPALTPPDVTRGGQVAHQLCAACHAVDSTGESRRADAPPFRVLSERYNPISLEHLLGELSRTGHGDMRPVTLSEADAPAVAAYIHALEPASR